VENLHRASDTYGKSTKIFQDGSIHRLIVHQANYNDEKPAPVWLQLLWGEFIPEHWEDLRIGARQNFLVSPMPHIHPNAPTDSNMTKAAADLRMSYSILALSETLTKGSAF
jgi:hypothetical protein